MKEAIIIMLYTLGLTIVVSFAVAVLIELLCRLIAKFSGPAEDAEAAQAEELALVIAIARAQKR